MRKFKFIFLFVVIFLAQNVKANNYYYTNGSVSLTEREYNYVVQFYGTEYLENMTIDEYNWLTQLNVNNNDFEIKVADVNVDNGMLSPYSTVVTSNEKRIAISKSCSDLYCSITTLVTWLNQPTIKSYDVIGARFVNTTLYNNSITTLLTTSSGTTIESNYKNYYNGFGNSVKLPSSDIINSIEQRFKVNKNGTIYASYQHATSNVTLSTSKLYNISSSGYGSVFNFTGNAYGKYDGSLGVYIQL